MLVLFAIVAGAAALFVRGQRSANAAIADDTNPLDARRRIGRIGERSGAPR